MDKHDEAREALTKFGAAVLRLDQDENGTLVVPLSQTLFARFDEKIEEMSRAIERHQMATINRRRG